MCMKQPYFFLSLLIPGPKAPGNDIDVYLEPLVDELQELWYNGVNTYDSSRKENFCMRATLLWTINDFPAYAYLSGWSTKGALACPSCNKETPSTRLKYGRKLSYMGARRFLSPNHKWRGNKRDFNGEVERRPTPKILSGDDILNQLDSLEDIKFGKTQKRKRQEKSKGIHNWRKKSIFFKLPYWKNNLIRHNIDVMHIEKIVCDNIIGTLLDMEGKTKDNLNARRDLKEMVIRKDLHPTQRDGKWYYPASCYTLSPYKKSKVCKFLKTIKVPDGYSSNLSRCVKLEDRKIYGMKSHDSHILLEQLLPFAIRGVLPNHAYNAITELSIFFRELCSKTIRVGVLDQLATQIPITLSKIEKIFLPTFFDIMVHLVIHLPREAKLAGPVQYRWMYPIERFLRKLKCYVRNRSRPEGSIAEGYIVEESLIFCSRYLHGSEKWYNRVEKNDEDNHVESYYGLSIFEQKGGPLLRDTSRNLEELERKQAHLYVLRNCDEVQPFLKEYEQSNSDMNFDDWFFHRIMQMRKEGNSHVSCGLYSLARGPFDGIQRFKGYEINGFRFHTKQLEGNRVRQNSGVLVRGVTNGQNTNYYGVITEIIELQYFEGKRIVLFQCDWWDVDHIGKGVKIDKYDFVSVNTNRKLATNEPFVLPSQAEQVFYVKDNLHSNLSVVLNGHSAYLADGTVNEETFQQDAQDFSCTFEEDEDFMYWRRNDLGVISTDVTLTDDIIEDIESEPETDDEDLLL
nr:uncharacterized protein LOC104115034 isoform X1 [Nicotiana tomentosiformis]XP_018632796.1 uncharacterized protein LOC104115034 isoform X1 [Nicotiana tomentosiformis]XP_018632797.1 uncharacterized protein LOC104115034 isoform X1 [Nicotiana tomentosiformis]